jgi:hypothetical protein
MNVSILHAQVRQLMRGAQTNANALEQLSDAERLALQALRERLGEVGNDLERAAPVSGYSVWIAPSSRVQ